MNEGNEQLLTQARTHVTYIFNQQVDPLFVFHNLEHTEMVVETCSLMADFYSLTEDERVILLLAAWFHDTGYSSGTAEEHETESIRHATRFLHLQEVDETKIQRVSSCIEATRMPQSPITQVEKILCDADLSNLGSEEFKARNALLKQERESLIGRKIDKKEWRKSNVQFLQQHKYFTDYAQQQWDGRKAENLAALQKKKGKKGKTAVADTQPAFPYQSFKSGKEDTTEQKNLSRGMQTMFRSTASNHYQLSSLADRKANIMISVNSILISVTLTVLVARLTYYPQYIIPALILLGVCLTAITFAILATRPSVSKGQFTEEDVRNKSTNLLFFGNFYKMSVDEYQWGMNELIKDNDYLYNSMIKDIYFLGVVLGRKYHYLRIAYTIFMWGLIATVIAFAIATVVSLSPSAAAEVTSIIDY